MNVLTKGSRGLTDCLLCGGLARVEVVTEAAGRGGVWLAYNIFYISLSANYNSPFLSYYEVLFSVAKNG